MISLDSTEWKQVCDIIDKLNGIGDVDILCDCISMLCVNCDGASDLVIGHYGDDIYGE